MAELAERAWFLLCGALGRMLRAGRYAETRIVRNDGELRARKQRSSYAPLLVRVGDPLMRILDTGVRILPQPEWEAREIQLYRALYGTTVRIAPGGVLVLPFLPGRTLADLLEDPKLEASDRRLAIESAVAALVELHQRGFSHGDAMAENVMVDLEGGTARWFDFESVHDAGRPLAWRRADDVRALLATCLVRTVPAKLAETLQLVLDVYADESVTPLVATSFTSVLRRPLTFHLGQAALSLPYFREIDRLLGERLAE